MDSTLNRSKRFPDVEKPIMTGKSYRTKKRTKVRKAYYDRKKLPDEKADEKYFGSYLSSRMFLALFYYRVKIIGQQAVPRYDSLKK